jgi:phosphate acetyltransferase
LPPESLTMPTFPHLDRLIADAARLGPVRAAVAYPCSAGALDAAITAQRLGLITPILVGPADEIRRVAAASGIAIDGFEIVETGPNPTAAAVAAVALSREGKAAILVKGSLHSDEMLGAVTSRDSRLLPNRRLSHAFYFDIPTYSKPLILADCVVHVSPDLMAKRDIIQNAVDLAHKLGNARPLVGVLSAVETVNPAIPGTIEAAALSKMADRGQITGAEVDGPLAFDNAISLEAARIKGIVSPVAGQADILLVPNLEAGNMLYKQLVYLAKAECAGIILGTKAPLVLTSRADSELCRVASCALAALQAKR